MDYTIIIAAISCAAIFCAAGYLNASKEAKAMSKRLDAFRAWRRDLIEAGVIGQDDGPTQ